MTRTHSKLGPTAALALLVVVASGAEGPGGAARRQVDQAALKPFAGLVGEWKGTGQPQRGSARGSWTETADWAWALTGDSAALKLTIAKGKLLASALLKPAGAGVFKLEAELSDGSKRTFVGKRAGGDGGKLVLVASGPDANGPRRVTLTPLHEARFLLLLESYSADSDRYARIAEVGYTRQGVAFAAGESGPTCIVTGGRGTVQVSFEGKSYWVCCSGCRDLFNDDPGAILAEAEAKRKASGK